MKYRELKSQIQAKVKEFRTKNREIHGLDPVSFRRIQFVLLSETKQPLFIMAFVVIFMAILCTFVFAKQKLDLTGLYNFGCSIGFNLCLYMFYLFLSRLSQRWRLEQCLDAEYTIYFCSRGWLRFLDKQIAELDVDLAKAREAKAKHDAEMQEALWSAKCVKEQAETEESAHDYTARVAEAHVYRPLIKPFLKTIVEEFHGQAGPKKVVDKDGKEHNSLCDMTVISPFVDWKELEIYYESWTLPLNPDGLRLVMSRVALLRLVMKEFNAMLETDGKLLQFLRLHEVKTPE